MSQSLSEYLGIQAGVADSAENILTKLKTVDGAGSGLDADTVDGQSLGTMAFKNTDDVGSITANTVTATSFSGDGSQLTGIITSVSAGTGISVSGNGTITISHSDTSSQTSANNSGATVIQDVTLDTYGHVTALASKTLAASDLNLGTSNDVQFDSFGVGTAASGTTGEIRATNDITAYYSDDRLKTRLGNINHALEKLSTLDSFYYEPNEIAQKLGYKIEKRVGLSAQQVQSVLPEAVKPAPIDERYLALQYEKLIPLLVSAINELQKKIEILEEK